MLELKAKSCSRVDFSAYGCSIIRPLLSLSLPSARSNSRRDLSSQGREPEHITELESAAIRIIEALKDIGYVEFQADDKTAQYFEGRIREWAEGNGTNNSITPDCAMILEAYGENSQKNTGLLNYIEVHTVV